LILTVRVVLHVSLERPGQEVPVLGPFYDPKFGATKVSPHRMPLCTRCGCMASNSWWLQMFGQKRCCPLLLLTDSGSKAILFTSKRRRHCSFSDFGELHEQSPIEWGDTQESLSWRTPKCVAQNRHCNVRHIVSLADTCMICNTGTIVLALSQFVIERLP